MDYVAFDHCLQTSMLGELAKFAVFAFAVDAFAQPDSLGCRVALGICSPLVGLSLAGITLATKVATIGEIIFKGVANIACGLLGKEDFSATLGAKQLGIALPAAIIDLIIGAPIHMAYNLIGDTLGIALSALKFSAYTEKRCEWHDEKFDQLEDAITSDSIDELVLDNEPQAKLARFVNYPSFTSYVEATKSAPQAIRNGATLMNFIIYGNNGSTEIVI